MPMIVGASRMVVYHLVMSVVTCFVVGFIIDAARADLRRNEELQQARSGGGVLVHRRSGWAAFNIVPYVGWLLGLLVALYGDLPAVPRPAAGDEERRRRSRSATPRVVIVIAIVVGFVIAIVGGLITAPAMMARACRWAARARASPTTRTASSASSRSSPRRWRRPARRWRRRRRAATPTSRWKRRWARSAPCSRAARAWSRCRSTRSSPCCRRPSRGCRRSSSSTDRSGVAGVMVAKAGNVYADQGRQIQLEIVDSGGVAGLTAFAAFAALGVQTEKETDSRIERTRREGNRLGARGDLQARRPQQLHAGAGRPLRGHGQGQGRGDRRRSRRRSPPWTSRRSRR